jgi:hypothetical protein
MSISINVDLDDVYYEMSNWDKEQMAEWLCDDGYCTLNEDDRDEDEEEFKIVNPTILDEMWVDTMRKLFHSRMQLSVEDEETIKNIVNKL